MNEHTNLIDDRARDPGEGASGHESWWPLALYALAVTVIVILVVVSV